MAEWYEEQDFDANPLEQETRLIGNEGLVEEIEYALDAGNIIILEGEAGAGKTRLLKEIVVLKGAELIDCKGSSEDIIDILKKKKGVFARLFSNQLPRNASLLLDNAECLSARNIEKLKYLYDHNLQLFREKIGYELLPDKVIKEAYRLSDKNVKKFLANCESLLKLKRKDIQAEDVAKFLKGGEQ
ncbi:hypothetical protein HZB88_00340 [archaeon]|nr:hypothetical protein [archaeon]